MGKSRRKKEICAYCGRDGPATRDHIPPKGLFPEPLPSDMLTVPCCESCRQGWSNDDEYFRDVILTASNYENDPRVKSKIDTILRSIQKPNKIKYASMLTESISQVETYSKGGIYLGKNPVMTVKKPRIRRVLERIVRGLYFVEFKTVLTEEYCAGGYIDQFGEHASQMLQQTAFSTRRSYADNMFAYVFSSVEGNIRCSLWIGAFHGKVGFIGYTKVKETGQKEEANLNN